MLRFVLLRHDCPADYRDGPHWDLMLERPDTAEEHRLATWSLLALPAGWSEPQASDQEPASKTIKATKLPDHRAHYLAYEGPVSGNRGSVARVAGGRVEWLEASDSLYRFRLSDNSRMAGLITLEAYRETVWHLSLS